MGFTELYPNSYLRDAGMAVLQIRKYLEALLADCLSYLHEAIGTPELEGPAFWTFEDMNHFEPRLYLA